MPRRSGPQRERALALVGFVVLTLVFTLHGFPREDLETSALRRFEAALGARAHFQDVEVGLDWGIPKLRLRRGRLVWPGGDELVVRYARAMPRANWGWLIGRPSFHVKVNAEGGRFKGWISPYRQTAQGAIEELELGALPYERLGLGGLRLTGRGEVAFEGSLGETLWNGSVNFRAVDGTATLPNAPLPVPFQLLSGSVELDEQKAEIVDPVRFEGPMGRIATTGRVGRAVPDPGLNLEVELDLRDPTLLQLLTESGLRIRPGAREVHIGGTLSNPLARATSARRR